MCPRSRSHRTGASPGFTLLELIVIITVMALLAALALNLMGTQLLRSSNPAIIADDAASAEAAMEAVVADFNNRMNDNATFTDLDGLKNAYTGNSTVSIVDNNNWHDGVRALVVTTTVGDTSYTTLLPQTRTNNADNLVSY